MTPWRFHVGSACFDRSANKPKQTQSTNKPRIQTQNTKGFCSPCLQGAVYSNLAKVTYTAEMMSVPCVAIFWVVNTSSDEKSCLQFLIPTESGAGGEGGVSHALNHLPLASALTLPRYRVSKVKLIVYPVQKIKLAMRLLVILTRIHKPFKSTKIKFPTYVYIHSLLD